MDINKAIFGRRSKRSFKEKVDKRTYSAMTDEKKFISFLDELVSDYTKKN